MSFPIMMTTEEGGKVYVYEKHPGALTVQVEDGHGRSLLTMNLGVPVVRALAENMAEWAKGHPVQGGPNAG